MALRHFQRDELSGRLARLWDASAANGNEPRFLEVVANAPNVAEFYFDRFYGDLFFNGIAPRRVKELVRLRLSQLHGCAS
jgi:alkylhydroperoxidase family enzyme